MDSTEHLPDLHFYNSAADVTLAERKYFRTHPVRLPIDGGTTYPQARGGCALD
jgi:hypothetical protein